MPLQLRPTVQKRLPKFKLPLAADDRDALLDLQAAFARAYDLGQEILAPTD